MSSKLFAPETHNTPPNQLNFDALPLRQWPDQWHPTEDFLTPQAVGSDEFNSVVNDGLSFGPAASGYRLGEAHLPIAPYREFILRTVHESQSTVLSSETGSGKSSQLGLYLLEAGVPRVFVSSPRILAARELKERAQYNLGEDYAHLAGYLTGDSTDSDCSPEAKLVYITEQLLFKMVNRGELRPGDVVINDEAHERTVGTVALLGLMKEVMSDDPDIKLLVSSATIDTQKFSVYLSDHHTGKLAPVLTLPGRTFPIVETHSDKTVSEVARDYMKDGLNVLAYESGNARQVATAQKMASGNKTAHVHILYGDQSPTEQRKSLNPEDGHHLVASKIGETSITPEGKDAVVDSGLSNIGLYEAGVRVLKTVFSSKATMTQRKGRVGRVKEGFYTAAVPDCAPAPKLYEDRDEYDPPAMETSSVASYLAELLASGTKLEKLDMIEYPTRENLLHDYNLLRKIGAIVMNEGEPSITEVGRQMINLPLDVPLSRMLVAARDIDKHYEVDVDAVRLQVAAAAAISQVNGILNARHTSKRRYLLSRRHEENLSNENMSDMLFSVDVFVRMMAKQSALAGSSPENAEERFEKYLEDKDVLANRYYKALRGFNELCRREGLDPAALAAPTADERKAIIACQITGAEELFVQTSKHWHRDIRGQGRRVGRRSTINPANAGLVIGSAFDLRGLSDRGRYGQSFITGGSVVSAEQLLLHAPDRVTRKVVGHAVTKDGTVVEKQALFFDSEIQFDEVSGEPQPSIETREFILRSMLTGIAPSAHKESMKIAYDPQTPNATRAIRQHLRAQELDHKSPGNLMVNERYEKLVRKIISESVSKLPLDVIDPQLLDEAIPSIFVNALVRPSRKKDIPEILQRSPDAIPVTKGEDHKAYLPVTYRNNIAYITIPREMQYTITREDFAGLEAHHPIKIRVANGKYSQLEVAFGTIEDRQNSPQRQKRIERRTKVASTESTPESFLEAVERAERTKKQISKPKVSPDLAVRRKHTHHQHRRRSSLKDSKDPKKSLS